MANPTFQSLQALCFNSVMTNERCKLPQWNCLVSAGSYTVGVSLLQSFNPLPHKVIEMQLLLIISNIIQQTGNENTLTY